MKALLIALFGLFWQIDFSQSRAVSIKLLFQRTNKHIRTHISQYDIAELCVVPQCFFVDSLGYGGDCMKSSLVGRNEGGRQSTSEREKKTEKYSKKHYVSSLVAVAVRLSLIGWLEWILIPFVKVID